MFTVEIIAADIAVGDRVDLAGSSFTVTRRVHGAWYLDGPRSRYVEFELSCDIPGVGTFVPSTVRVPRHITVMVSREQRVDSSPLGRRAA